ncbi:hypothetical protein GCM10010265_23030 [Streptomyces griseoincarnatus]|nr:hypothetical protein GCM10010265_23030 [Streptomyces griseoincarnatus]
MAGSGEGGTLVAGSVVRRVRARSWLVAQFPAPLGVFGPAVGPAVPRASVRCCACGRARASRSVSVARRVRARSWLVAQFPAPLGVFGPAVGWALGRMGLAAAGVVRRVRARSWLVAQFPAPLRGSP